MIIRNYTNTLIELKSCEARYKYLSERREVYYVKYLGVKSPTYDSVGGHKNWAVDGMSIFLDLVTTKDPKTGLSLDDELEKIAGEMAELTRVLKQMARYLKQMEGIQYQLFYRIVVEGLSTTEAVKKIAEENYMTERNVWRNYYSEIKEYLHELRANVRTNKV